MMMNKEQYGEYLLTEGWQRKREPVLQRCNGICERCHSERARDVHHTPKAYNDIPNEKPADLLALCRECHEFVHGRSIYDPLNPTFKCVDCGRQDHVVMTMRNEPICKECLRERKLMG